MGIKSILVSLFVLTICSSTISLENIRYAYINTVGDEKATTKLHEELDAVSKSEDKTLVAYKGAVTTMMAKYTKSIKEKKIYFKEGAELLEFALAEEPNNVEIRCIRLSVQENVPKITGYTKNIEEDKEFILNNLKSVSDQNSRDFVEGYISKSKVFDETERQLLQGS